ncbi:MAG: hypothetical protein M0Z45_03495 [Actinomycetota bacterium]|nr:hypothetical protein [Actinomycetota bacterium]
MAVVFTDTVLFIPLRPLPFLGAPLLLGKTLKVSLGGGLPLLESYMATLVAISNVIETLAMLIPLH